MDRPDLDAAARGCVICDAAANRSRESDDHGLTRDAVLRRGVAAAAAAAVLGAGPLAQAARATAAGAGHTNRAAGGCWYSPAGC